MRTRLPVILALLVLSAALAPHAVRADDRDAFAEARRLEAAGMEAEAFGAYLGIPGAAHHAARVGRASPADFMARCDSLLAEQELAPERCPVLLVRGDLLLLNGDRQGALASYRAVAEALPRTADELQAAKAALPGVYVVEPARNPELPTTGPLFAFAIGPGSHRDNWLLRRFLALEAWPEAAAELDRIWAYHRAATGGGAFTTPALQFAIDYAFFLKKRGHTERAHHLLLEPLTRLDLDRVPSPSTPRVGPGFRGAYGGISPKEYVRLVHGEFRGAGREADLVAALEAQIEGGRNAARRILARVHTQAGRIDRAVDLELEYIEAAALDPRSTALRRGRVFEAARKLREAAAAYEAAATLPAGPADLPDPDRADLFRRLERIHTALGDPDTALDHGLRALDADPKVQRRLDTLEHGLVRWRAAGKESRYRAWLQTRAAESTDPQVRANAAWVLGDAAATIRHLTAPSRMLGRHDRERWKERFREHDHGAYCELLSALTDADPTDAHTRFQLLAAEDRLASDAAVALFEDLLEGRAPYEAGIRHRARGVPELPGWGELAYRLMRLYERRGEVDKLQQLAIRIARLDPPFTSPDPDRHRYRDGNGEPENRNACLALAVQTARTASDLDALEAALQGSPWEGARRQLERRRATSWPTRDVPPDFGWANLPEAVRLLAGNEDVLCLAQDGAHVYAGHPWGVAIYDRSGSPVIRVALAAAAQSLAAGADALWAATPQGVFRIGLERFDVRRLPGDQDLDPRRNPDDRRPYLDHGARAVAVHQGRLWIGTRRDVRTLDPATGALRIYTPEELDVEDARTWWRIWIDGQDLWAVGDEGARRYDAHRDRWQAPERNGLEPHVRVLGRAAGDLWGDVDLGLPHGHRPCRIDLGGTASGLAPRLDVLPLASDPPPADGYVPGSNPWSLYGTWEGKPVFGDRGPTRYLDPDSATLRCLPATPEGRTLPFDLDAEGVPRGLWHSRIRPHAGGELRGESQSGSGTTGHLGFSALRWTFLVLDDGTRVVGGRPNDTRHEYPREDWPPHEVHPREQSPALGGLWFFPPTEAPRRVSAAAPGDSLPADVVFEAVREPEGGDPRRTWLATRAGLVVLDDQYRVRCRLGRADGLVADRFDAAAALGGKVYFGSSWGDRGGGLSVFDPRTRVFTSLHPADGLATDRIAGLRAGDVRLRIDYGLQYRRWGEGDRYQLHQPGTYDPAARRFGPPKDVLRFARAEEAPRAARPSTTAPWLGGHVVSELDVRGARVICTTHGVVVMSEDVGTPPPVPPVEAELLSDQPLLWKRAAYERPIDLRTVEDVALLARDPNPYVRSRALDMAVHSDALSPELVTAVGSTPADDHAFVRRSAIRLVGKLRTPRARPTLERALADPDRTVRQQAALGLARIGLLPDIDLLRQLIEQEGNHYYSSALEVYEALATTPSPEVVSLFLEFPLPTDDYEPRVRVAAQLGRSLVDWPRSVDMLLSARQQRGARLDAVSFAQAVLAGGGGALLDRLHEALGSPDRVHRSNAARALGRIRDRASIEPLIRALDLESGLARASIVWALGRLEAREALPHLARLYLDARADQRRRAGAGYRIAQSDAEIRAAYESLSTLDDVSGDWDELRAVALQGPVPPLSEPLLDPETILEAVASIGADAAGPFYRRVASEGDWQARAEAARQLARGRDADREENEKVLRGLSADVHRVVRIEACVSLLTLGYGPQAEDHIRACLRSRGSGTLPWCLNAFERVEDKRLLEPFRPELEAVAADRDVYSEWRKQARRFLRRGGDR